MLQIAVREASMLTSGPWSGTAGHAALGAILICTLPSAASCICATEPLRTAYLTGLRMVSVSPILVSPNSDSGAVDHFAATRLL
jgi:hypothetical protein